MKKAYTQGEIDRIRNAPRAYGFHKDHKMIVPPRLAKDLRRLRAWDDETMTEQVELRK